MKTLFPLIAVMLLMFSGCGSDGPESEGPYSFSFEHDFQGWTVQGTDLEVGNSTIPWSIERTQDRATEGNTSLRLYLDNLNDAGKIWTERQFVLLPDTDYRVKIAYDFATRDFGDLNLFTIITGASGKKPQSRNDLTYQDTTGNGSAADVGYVWLKKSYEVTAHSDDKGNLYVAIGVWGTFETARTYYLDNVQVTFERL